MMTMAGWWVIASVDDEEALRHGPYEDQADAEKEAVKLVAEFESIEDEEDLRRIIESDLPTRH